MNELLAHIQERNAKTIAWVNEDPDHRGATTWLEDINYWNGQGIYTVADFKRYLIEGDIWDLYKDVHGIRPRWINFDAMTLEDLEAFMDGLLEDLQEENERRAIEEAHAIQKFEKLIADTIQNGAGDRETAIRWLKQADEYYHDESHMCYEYGLPYGYFKKSA